MIIILHTVKSKKDNDGTQMQIYTSASTDDYDILKLTLASNLFFLLSFNVSHCVLLVVIIFYLIQSQTI
jgi:hypothetical protein